MRNLINKSLNAGIYNAPDLETIPRSAARKSLGFLTTFKGVELAKGKVRLGNLSTGGGSTSALHFGYRVDSTAVAFRQISTAVQYYNSANLTWTNVITGLTSGNKGTFTNVVGLAGNFVFFFSRDGIWKIPVANPASAIDMYSEAINFKGNALFDAGRHYLWNREKDTTGLYLSHIDEANYTTVDDEALSDVSSGTLAFKGSTTRSCFGIELTVTTSGQVFTDDLNGVLNGDQGGVGTINYATGAYTTDDTGAGTVDYQWEDSNNGGVTDFRYSATRVAGEGDVLRQDEGGDAIQQVHALESSHFSFKKQRIYKLTLDDTDTTGNNRVFRTGVGIPSMGASTPTSSGIVFLNTFNPDNPELHILERNPFGDNFNTRNLTPQFNYSGYTFDECVMDTFGDYVLFTGKTQGATANNLIFMVNLKLNNAVSVLLYHADSFAKDGGYLYIGDSLSNNVYQILSGNDDDGGLVTAYWEGNEEEYDTESLKRQRKVRFKGFIAKDQSFLVQVSYDNADFQTVGTISGDGSYVDGGSPYLIGSDIVGAILVGGNIEDTVYPYIKEFKINSPKFRKRVWRIVPQALGYMSLTMIHDIDILLYEEKLPTKYRG